tara:strand:- start:1004 stop:1870 length:867 start_codon:yes stop_codon:yes gene_type:complete
MAEGSQDNSGLGFIASLIILALYFFLMKPTLKLEMLNPDNQSAYFAYTRNTYLMLVVLIIMMVLAHTVVNVIGFQSKCGGSLMANFGKVFLETIVPWTLIFGAVVFILIIFPGFKGVFANVIGYYLISKKSSKLLIDLLGDPKTEMKIDNVDDATDAEKSKLRAASDAVLKMVGNTSLMVNQITPGNFVSMWDMMTPIMKDKFKKEPALAIDIKKGLLEGAVFRDTVGEFGWYLYTSLLLIIVVKSRLTAIQCSNNLANVKEKVAKFDAEQKVKNAASEKRKKMIYTG